MADQQPELSSRSNRLMVPPADWGFNNLVADIIRGLRNEDIEQLKLRFIGILNRDVRSWVEAFHILKIKGYISEDNLIYLQHIIHGFDRADLLERTIEYARNHQQRVLYFYKTTADIRPGHRLVQIHVEGWRCQIGGELETIRMTISQILSVSPKDIVVAGIEEANSLYITVTLPAVYVKTLEKFLQNKTKHHILRPLVQLGIDRIKIAETSFKLEPGEEAQRSYVESDRIKIISKFQLELQQKACQIKQLEEEILRQRRIRDEVSHTNNQSSWKQSTRKRKPMPDLKEPGNKRSNIERTGSCSYDLRERRKQKQDGHTINDVIVI